jgi:alpha-glucosidase
LTVLDGVGAPSTWVLSNHDVVRHASRFGYNGLGPRDGDGIGPADPQPDTDLGRQRAAAASLFMLGLPGAAYLYQGEELGLPDGIDIPGHLRQDPTFARTGGQRLGRDGCRVPLPWRVAEPHFGFGHGDEPWLPLPASFGELARDVQAGSPSSHLALYRTMLAVRRELDLGRGSLAWAEDWCTASSLAYVNGATLVLMNLNHEPLEMPAGQVLVRSTSSESEGLLASGETAWIRITSAG